MNVVDSSAWLEYFAGGENAEPFAPIVAVMDELVVPTITLCEVFKVILREADENSALQAIAVMQKGRVVELGARLAVSAAKLSMRHGLPMADAIILATAQAEGAILWTQDQHFKDIAGVRYFAKG